MSTPILTAPEQQPPQVSVTLTAPELTSVWLPSHVGILIGTDGLDAHSYSIPAARELFQALSRALDEAERRAALLEQAQALREASEQAQREADALRADNARLAHDLTAQAVWEA